MNDGMNPKWADQLAQKLFDVAGNRSSQIGKTKLATSLSEVLPTYSVDDVELGRALADAIEVAKRDVQDTANKLIEGINNRENNLYRSSASFVAITNDLRKTIYQAREAERTAIRTMNELKTITKNADAVMARPVNVETRTTNPTDGHFTCEICGCQMGKMSLHGRGWEWALPKFCPNCGARVVKEEE